MEKEEYLRLLEIELAALPLEEKENVMEYYRSYFEEAGEENHNRVIKELGKPEELAAHILKNSSCLPSVLGKKNKSNQQEKTEERKNKTMPKDQKNENRGNKILLVLLILVFSFPLWFPLICSIFGILFAFVVVTLSIGFIGIIIGLALMIASIVLGTFALFSMILFTPSFFLFLGLSLLLMAFGIVGLVLGIWFCKKMLPPLVRFIVSLFSIPFRNRSRV